MFSEDGLKCHLKRRKQFFEENTDLSKKNRARFCQFSFVYILETTMYECSILCCSLRAFLILRLCQRDFIRPQQNLSRQY